MNQIVHHSSYSTVNQNITKWERGKVNKKHEKHTYSWKKKETNIF